MSIFDEFRHTQIDNRAAGDRTAPGSAPTEAAPAQSFAPPPPRLDGGESPTESGLMQERRRKLTALRQAAHAELLETFNLSALMQFSEDEIKTEIGNIVRGIIPKTAVALSRSERDQLISELYYEVMGLGPLEVLLKDDTISDILINGPEQVLVERNGLIEETDVQFQSEGHLRRILQKVLAATGRRLDESVPYVDARLPDGSRLNAVISPIAMDGTLVSIRKRRREQLSLEQIEFNGTLNAKMAAYLRAAVASRLNIVVSGGTGSGKSTMLNALSAYISKRERILTIEDTAELELQQSHVGRMESRPPNVEGKGAVTQRDCLRNALRMRPDRIIVGEIRGEEVIDMLQAMNTGHNGSMTTIHSNSARDATLRIENMIAMAGIEIPLSALRRQISSAIHVIVHVERLQDGARKIMSIQEVIGCEGEVLTMQELFFFEQDGILPNGRVEGHFSTAGVRSHFIDHFRRWNIRLPDTTFTEAG
jgi:pilus assembly protein CpaF